MDIEAVLFCTASFFLKLERGFIMKMLTVSYHIDEINVYDDDEKVFHGQFLHQQDVTYILHDAYDKEVLSLKTLKRKRSFFQRHKKDIYTIMKDQVDCGHFLIKKTCVSCDVDQVTYTMYSGVINGNEMLLIYDDQKFIAQIDIYQKESVLFLKDVSLTHIAVFMYMFFLEIGKVYSDVASFVAHLPHEMEVFL